MEGKKKETIGDLLEKSRRAVRKDGPYSPAYRDYGRGYVFHAQAVTNTVTWATTTTWTTTTAGTAG